MQQQVINVSFFVSHVSDSWRKTCCSHPQSSDNAAFLLFLTSAAVIMLINELQMSDSATFMMSNPLAKTNFDSFEVIFYYDDCSLWPYDLYHYHLKPFTKLENCSTIFCLLL